MEYQKIGQAQKSNIDFLSVLLSTFLLFIAVHLPMLCQGKLVHVPLSYAWQWLLSLF